MPVMTSIPCTEELGSPTGSADGITSGYVLEIVTTMDFDLGLYCTHDERENRPNEAP